MVGLDDSDRSALEHRLATQTGLPLDALRLATLTANRDDALLVLHDRDDREVPFTHGEQLAASWPNAQLHAAQGLGHRRILRDEAIVADVTAYIREGVPLPASDLVREIDRQLDAR
jgi:pimeloyl-ACP methyl ester carboxylesterase